MRIALSFFLLTGIINNSFAQDDSIAVIKKAPQLKEVIITGIQNTQQKSTSLNLQSYSSAKLDAYSPSNLSDALSNITGIGQMTTGNAISKPVIRGLYGNRVLVLLSGMRFDNQQWQDEHGLGLSQIGIDRIELIKGPASILYGSDALGGVINIIEQTPHKQESKFDVTTRVYSNTEGTLTDVGYQNRKNNKWIYLRAGIETHADYADGNNNRVLNSRNKGYYAKAGAGFEKKKWEQQNSYNYSYNEYGFIINNLNQFFDTDNRWARNLPGPHHTVILHTFSSQNTIKLNDSKLKINAGIQSNKRKEDEGGGSISLNMHLLSLLESAKWEKQINNKLFLVGNQQFTYEKNTNLGKRILVPDANMLEGSISGFLRIVLGRVNIETGAGLSYKEIQTFTTGRLNSTSQEIRPFRIGKPVVNGLLGFSYNPTQKLNLKYNISSGFRTGNLAELSSNGLHEGSYRYEIGNTNLETEQNINNDITIAYTSPIVSLTLSGYYNRFLNYIYLAPTNDSFVGFQIFRYKQQNASIFGNEFEASVKICAGLHIKESLATTRGTTDDGGNLPFIPAYKNVLSIHYTKTLRGKIQDISIEPAYEYYFRQNNPAMFELATPSYSLLNLYTAMSADILRHNFTFSLSCKNLLNKAYASHLSRIRYYGMLNQGINFIISIHTEFK